MPKQTLLCEAKRLNIYKPSDQEDTLRTSIGDQWRTEIRTELSKAQIDTSDVEDGDIEPFYNLYLSIQWGLEALLRSRLGALLQMSNREINPRTVSHKKLLAFMKEHHLSIPESASKYLQMNPFSVDSCASLPWRRIWQSM